MGFYFGRGPKKSENSDLINWNFEVKFLEMSKDFRPVAAERRRGYGEKRREK
jgi:hypothetical protein